MKSNAQRQAAYRQRHLHDEGGTKSRLNVLLDYRARLALRRLAKRAGVTQSEMLAHLILADQDRVLASMSGDQQTAYYDSVTA